MKRIAKHWTKMWRLNSYLELHFLVHFIHSGSVEFPTPRPQSRQRGSEQSKWFFQLLCAFHFFCSVPSSHLINIPVQLLHDNYKRSCVFLNQSSCLMQASNWIQGSQTYTCMCSQEDSDFSIGGPTQAKCSADPSISAWSWALGRMRLWSSVWGT